MPLPLSEPSSSERLLTEDLRDEPLLEPRLEGILYLVLLAEDPGFGEWNILSTELEHDRGGRRFIFLHV